MFFHTSQILSIHAEFDLLFLFLKLGNINLVLIFRFTNLLQFFQQTGSLVSKLISRKSGVALTLSLPVFIKNAEAILQRGLALLRVPDQTLKHIGRVQGLPFLAEIQQLLRFPSNQRSLVLHQLVVLQCALHQTGVLSGGAHGSGGLQLRVQLAVLDQRVGRLVQRLLHFGHLGQLFQVCV